MNRYLATFHTHLSALITSKNLTNNGISAKLAPVPRKVSSSCGTCVIYTANTPSQELMDKDVDSIYTVCDDEYMLIE